MLNHHRIPVAAAAAVLPRLFRRGRAADGGAEALDHFLNRDFAAAAAQYEEAVAANPYRGPAFHQYPLELYRFSDGLFVRGAGPGYESIVGGRVLGIGGRSAEEAMARVAPLCSRDNPMGIMSMAPRRLVIPEVLSAAGIIEDESSAPFAIETVGGETLTVSLAPGPLGHGDHDRELVRANADATAPLPLYLQKPREAFWFEYIEDQKLVYFQFNVVRDTPDESLAAFVDRLFAFIEANPVEHLVIDMRHNSGGNNFLNRALVHGLIKCEQINREGRLFVITGRMTFSAAMNGATDIEQNTNAMFVGEPTGSKPNFVGESTMITLPCSGLRLSCSSLYWQRSTAMDDRIWIAPDLLAELSSEDYRTNGDPAMEAVLAFIAP